jgi:hypothetical protein
VRTAAWSPSRSSQATRKAPPGAAAIDQSLEPWRSTTRGAPKRPFAVPLATRSAPECARNATALVPSRAIAARGTGSPLPVRLAVKPRVGDQRPAAAAAAGTAAASSAAAAAGTRSDLGVRMATERAPPAQGCAPNR